MASNVDIDKVVDIVSQVLAYFDVLQLDNYTQLRILSTAMIKFCLRQQYKVETFDKICDVMKASYAQTKAMKDPNTNFTPGNDTLQ